MKERLGNAIMNRITIIIGKIHGLVYSAVTLVRGVEKKRKRW